MAPGIADLGKGAGRLLLITALLAYGFTLFSGFFTYFTCDLSYPWLLNTSDKLSAVADNTVALQPYFTVEMPAVMGVMSALILAFTLGLGMSVIDGNRLKSVMDDYDQFRAGCRSDECISEDYCRYFCDDRSLVVYSVFYRRYGR